MQDEKTLTHKAVDSDAIRLLSGADADEYLRQRIGRIQGLDPIAVAAATERQDQLTKPQGSLGRLEGLSLQLAGIYGEATPSVPTDKAVIVMAGDHGVETEGVSLYPQEVTAQMVYNFASGGAGINVLARHAGARVVVVDVGVAADLAPHSGVVSAKVALGTANIAVGPAMIRDEAMAAICVGIQIAEAEISRGTGLLATGDMGIANTTPSAALTSVFAGVPVAQVTGRGTGVDDAALARKIGVIERAIEVNRPDTSDPVGVLAALGGLEIAGIAGVIIAAAASRVPVIIDGFISGAAALVACAIAPAARDYLIPAHRSVEAGHNAALGALDLSPILDLGLRLGEGTGGALAMPLVEASLKILSEMATFADAGVAEAKE